MRSLLTVGLVFVLVTCSQLSLGACGDKFLIVGRGAQFNKVYAALYPGSIAIYTHDAARAADRTKDLRKLLTRAGHRVSVIAAQDLPATLQRGGIDIVIADSVEAPKIDRQLTTAGSRPTPLYVRMEKNKTDAGTGTPAYRLQQSDKGPRWLQVIDDAMQERVKAGTRIKG
jgi:hypothetical protein